MAGIFLPCLSRANGRVLFKYSVKSNRSVSRKSFEFLIPAPAGIHSHCGTSPSAIRKWRKMLRPFSIKPSSMLSPALRPRERDALIQSLRAGVTPRLGARHIQVGRDAEIAALDKDLNRIADGGSAVRLDTLSYGASTLRTPRHTQASDRIFHRFGEPEWRAAG